MSSLINFFGEFFQEKRTIFIESVLLALNLQNSIIYLLEIIYLNWDIFPNFCKLFSLFCYFCLFICLLLNITLLIIHNENFTTIDDNNKLFFSFTLIATIFSFLSTIFGFIVSFNLIKDLNIYKNQNLNNYLSDTVIELLILTTNFLWITIMIFWIVESIRIYYKINDTFSNYRKLISINSTFNKIKFSEDEGNLKNSNNNDKEKKNSKKSKIKENKENNIIDIINGENTPINENN